MKELPGLLGAWSAGFGLGLFFFGGLWWTVRRGVLSARAGLWFAASSLVRLPVTLAGIYWCTGGRWEKLLPCVLGFFVARLLAARFAGSPPPVAVRPAAEEGCHASDS